MSRMLSTEVKLSSYCREKPTMSKSRSRVAVSRVKSGNPRSRSSFSMSGHGAKTRSQVTPSVRFSKA